MYVWLVANDSLHAVVYMTEASSVWTMARLFGKKNDIVAPRVRDFAKLARQRNAYNYLLPHHAEPTDRYIHDTGEMYC